MKIGYPASVATWATITIGSTIGVNEAALGASAGVAPPSPPSDLTDCGPYEQVCHDISRLNLLTSNFGIQGYAPSLDGTCKDDGYVSLRKEGNDFMFLGAIWVGGIVGGDTLTSVGHDGWAHEKEFTPELGLTQRSDDPGSPIYDPAACAPLELISQYSDSLTNEDCPDVSPYHETPLVIAIEQTTRGWDNPTDWDYLLVDNTITNKSDETLRELRFGWYMDGDVGPTPSDWGDAAAIAQDDVTGYGVFEGNDGPLGYAWLADYDGPEYQNPSTGDATLTPDAMATALVWNSRGTPFPLQYDWWISDTSQNGDWGPGTGFGTPDGNAHKYMLMSGKQNEDLGVEYGDSLCIDPLWDPENFQGPCRQYRDPGQLGTLRNGELFAADDTRFLASFGPVTLEPGEAFSFSYALVVDDLYPTDDPEVRDFGSIQATLARASQRRAELCNPLDVSGETPSPNVGTFALHQNSPNPFNPHTTIQYDLSTASDVRLAVYNMSGALVRVLHEGPAAKGSHSVMWDGHNDAGQPVGSGVYLCRLVSGHSHLTKKLALVR